MSFNDTNDVTGFYKILGEQYTDNNIQDALDRAHRKLDRTVGRGFVQVITAETDAQEDFNLSFSELDSFTSAQHVDEDELIDVSNYTATNSTGVVSFTTAYAEDNISMGSSIRFRYVPTVYIDLELYYAVKDLATGATLQTRDGQTSINLEELNNEIQAMESSISSKSGNRLVRDHHPRFPVHDNVL